MAIFTNYLQNVLGLDSKAREALRLIPVFEHSSPELLSLIFRYGKVVHLQAEEILIKEGEFDQWVYVILKGSVAVFVQDRNIDKISSLCGERCMLGEARSATLKASGEVYAFGIDMSLLNSLTDSQADSSAQLALIELVALITDQVLVRILNLWFTLSYLKEYGRKNLENVGEKQLLEAFFSGDLVEHPSIMSYLWLLVKKSSPELAGEYWNARTSALDIRRLAFDLTKSGQQYLLLEWAKELLVWCQRNLTIDLALPSQPEIIEFEAITKPFLETLETALQDKSLVEKIKNQQGQFFSLVNGNLSLNPLRQFLLEQGIQLGELTELFLSMLKTALAVNQRLNQQIRQISQTHYLGAFLESEYFQEQKLFIRSKISNRLTSLDDLYQNLIEPYTSNLAHMLGEVNAEQPKLAEPAAKASNFDPSNFDELLKQLGATPGVPLETL